MRAMRLVAIGFGLGCLVHVVGLVLSGFGVGIYSHSRLAARGVRVR